MPYKTFKGYILAAIDSSSMILPNNDQLLETYGTNSNQYNNTNPIAKASFVYDVLNGIAIDVQLGGWCQSDLTLAMHNLETLKASNPELLQKMILVFDRGYCSKTFTKSILMKTIFNILYAQMSMLRKSQYIKIVRTVKSN